MYIYIYNHNIYIYIYILSYIYIYMNILICKLDRMYSICFCILHSAKMYVETSFHWQL